mmetsp:Transcript_26799/g.76723  ORF Transcript_26799/g.76723 Transcript_26799/m.76723 type:complete len:270 (+) Transcript_26799:416-1225(+)
MAAGLRGARGVQGDSCEELEETLQRGVRQRALGALHGLDEYRRQAGEELQTRLRVPRHILVSEAGQKRLQVCSCALAPGVGDGTTRPRSLGEVEEDRRHEQVEGSRDGLREHGRTREAVGLAELLAGRQEGASIGVGGRALCTPGARGLGALAAQPPEDERVVELQAHRQGPLVRWRQALARGGPEHVLQLGPHRIPVARGSTAEALASLQEAHRHTNQEGGPTVADVVRLGRHAELPHNLLEVLGDGAPHLGALVAVDARAFLRAGGL